MKLIVIALVAVAMLAACGSASKLPSSSASSATTYSSQAHKFALTYDPSTFHRVTKNLEDQFSLSLGARDFTGGVQLVAVSAGRQYVQQALAEWHKGDLSTSSGNAAAFGHWTWATSGADSAQWVTLNRVQGVKAERHKGSQKTVLFFVMQSDQIYLLSASAPASQWATDAAELDPVLQSFRVLK
jgi:hypothetical protein